MEHFLVDAWYVLKNVVIILLKTVGLIAIYLMTKDTFDKSAKKRKRWLTNKEMRGDYYTVLFFHFLFSALYCLNSFGEGLTWTDYFVLYFCTLPVALFAVYKSHNEGTGKYPPDWTDEQIEAAERRKKMNDESVNVRF